MPHRNRCAESNGNGSLKFKKQPALGFAKVQAAYNLKLPRLKQNPHRFQGLCLPICPPQCQTVCNLRLQRLRNMCQPLKGECQVVFGQPRQVPHAVVQSVPTATEIVGQQQGLTKQAEKCLAVSDAVQAECVFVLCGIYRHGGGVCREGCRQPAVDGALGISFEVQAALWGLDK